MKRYVNQKQDDLLNWLLDFNFHDAAWGAGAVMVLTLLIVRLSHTVLNPEGAKILLICSLIVLVLASWYRDFCACTNRSPWLNPTAVRQGVIATWITFIVLDLSEWSLVLKIFASVWLVLFLGQILNIYVLPRVRKPIRCFLQGVYVGIFFSMVLVTVADALGYPTSLPWLYAVPIGFAALPPLRDSVMIGYERYSDPTSNGSHTKGGMFATIVVVNLLAGTPLPIVLAGIVAIALGIIVGLAMLNGQYQKHAR